MRFQHNTTTYKLTLENLFLHRSTRKPSNQSTQLPSKGSSPKNSSAKRSAQNATSPYQTRSYKPTSRSAGRPLSFERHGWRDFSRLPLRYSTRQNTSALPAATNPTPPKPKHTTTRTREPRDQ